MDLRLGDFDAVIERIERRLADGGPDVQALDLLGQARALQNRPDAAAAAWEQAIALQPTSFRHLRLSKLYETMNLTELGQRHGRLARYRSGLEALRGGTHFERAVQDLEAAVSMGLKGPVVWFYIGEARRALGSENARRAYEKCLSVDPDYARARRALERLQ
jgi:tetratricopeptide (TPR) repeat protein